MEYVEGPTLAQRIEQGPVPLSEALETARQMAAALEEAHQNGSWHRDFKPSNVKLKPNGAVKVLDFGLAKQGRDREAAAHPVEDSPTITLAATQAGTLMGTAAYSRPSTRPETVGCLRGANPGQFDGPSARRYTYRAKAGRGLRDTLIKAYHADSPWGVRRGCFHDHADCRP